MLRILRAVFWGTKERATSSSFMTVIHVIYTYTFHAMTFLVPLVTHEAICLHGKGYMKRDRDFFLRFTHPSKQVKGRTHHCWMAAYTSALSCFILQHPPTSSPCSSSGQTWYEAARSAQGADEPLQNPLMFPQLRAAKGQLCPCISTGAGWCSAGAHGWEWGQKYRSRDLASTEAVRATPWWVREYMPSPAWARQN